MEYSYDAEERITRVKDSKNGTTFYTYDALGQLLTETVNDTVKTAMVYDNYGNIRIKNGIEYIYDSIWKDKLVRVGDKIISYDAQGNPTNYLGHNLSWEKGRQLKSFDYNTFTYNANGIRTSKYIKSTDAMHKYILDGTKILRESWTEHYTSMGNVVSTDYYIEPIYDNEDSVAGINFCGDVYFFNKNLQGDIVEIVSGFSGKTVAKYSYDAWGKCTVDSDSINTLIAERNPFRYRGYYYDSEIQMYYLQSRYYDPNVARFINGDAAEMIKLQIKGIFLSQNLFSYCYNNPINHIDETGFGVADALLEVVKTAFELITGINEFASTQKYTAKEIKKISKSTNKSRRQIEREIAAAKKETEKLAKKFKKANFWITVASIILIIYSCASNSSSIIRTITDCIVELLILFLIYSVSKIAKMLLRLVSIPGLGFVLGFLVGYAIEKLFSAWFSSKKKKRMKNKYYTLSSPLLKKKSIDILKYSGNFVKCLSA